MKHLSAFFFACVLGLLASSAGDARGQVDGWPSRSLWRATSSAPTQPSMAPALAIDGDPATRWGGPFSPGHWFQVDLGRAVAVGGVAIHWDTAFAVSYFIQVSTDGEHWSLAYQSTDSPGGIEYVGFPAVAARYVRLASVPRTADWGVNIYEFEPLSPERAPHVAGQPAALSGAAAPIGLRRPFIIETPFGAPVAGAEVFWAGPRGSAQLEGRDGSGHWRVIAQDPQGEGARSYLASAQAGAFTALRLSAAAVGGAPAQVSRIRVLSPSQALTPMRRYQIAAERRYSELFPDTLHARQVYWTVVGAPAALQKSVLDEWGDVEAFKGAPLVQPLWQDASGLAAPYGREVRHGLREGWMPMPWLEWNAREGVRIRSEAIATDGPVTWVRHRITNGGSAPVSGSFVLLMRPIQVSPPWQNGGPSPISNIALREEAGATAVIVNGRKLLQSQTPVSAAAVAPFGQFGETEITRLIAENRLPPSQTADDADGLAAAALRYAVTLQPGASFEVVVALPLADAAAPAASDFDAMAQRVADQWRERLGGLAIQLPDQDLVNTLRAQAAYMLLNQSGAALQPGPRNYDRSFIRDGSATASILLRMGETRVARDYLHWFAQHAVHENGLVSPILNQDGTVNRGFGSDLEHDSQGEFIWLVAQTARLDGGAASVREYRDDVIRALHYLQVLRERTLVDGYQADRPAPERFRGILAPSISHEGYATPTHSYWDDYWGLKGWRDGAWLAREWGDQETAAWATQQYQLLRESVARSMRATMQWRGIDFIPSSADLGDPDPTGVSIGVDPTDQQDLMPADALARTFDRYFEDVRQRSAGAANYAYTPYELRNVLTFVRLNRPTEAQEMLQTFLAGRHPDGWLEWAEVVNSDPRRAIYLGDMPHTWIGSEYARAIFGMIMHEGDTGLELLPGAPPSWLAGSGLSVAALPTACGRLTVNARQTDRELVVELGQGLLRGTRLQVFWPQRTAPREVLIDGRRVRGFDANSVVAERPFRRLVARW